MTSSFFQGGKEIDCAIKELKRAGELQRRNSILTNMVHIMRSKGASEQSIQKALAGTDEFAKFVIIPDGPSFYRGAGSIGIIAVAKSINPV